MNYTEHLLTCLAEECGEVAKEAHKALRFGLYDQVTINPNGPRGTTGPNNKEKIVEELNDLMGVVRMLETCGALPRDWQDAELQDRKVWKVSAFMGYARRVGALENASDQATASGKRR
jgi:hypothetical protein